jgi:TatD DNase family protein
VIFIDTHTHLYFRDFDPDRDEVVRSALDIGVRKMLMPNVDETTLEAMHALADKYPENCLPMIGLHPTSVNEGYREQIEKIMAFMGKRTYWGIGETGIDLYRDRTYAVQQEDSFREHIRIARASGLPVVIHARNSFD